MLAASVAVIPRAIPGTKMHRGVKGRAYMMEFFAREIPARAQERRQRPLHELCHATKEDGSLLSDQEIMDHMNFLMLAAHDTLTSSVSSLVYLLAANPEWQVQAARGDAGSQPAAARPAAV